MRTKRADARVARRLLIAADRVSGPADCGVGQRDRCDRGDDDEEDDLIVEAKRVDLAQAEERDNPQPLKAMFLPPVRPRMIPRPIVEALADLVDIVLLPLRARVRGRDVAIKLQIELHDR